METYQRLKVGIDVGGFGTHPTIWKLVQRWFKSFHDSWWIDHLVGLEPTLRFGSL